MIFPGLTSATTRACSVEETVDAACRGGLKGIEWEGLRHVPAGDLTAAEKVRELCTKYRLEIPSYGSYYKCATSEAEGMSFGDVLKTAQTLQAPMIRVWAGNKNYDQSSPAEILNVIDDTLRIADLSAAQNITLSFEFHGGTLTNTTDYALQFAAKVQHHPAVQFSWQPPHGLSPRAGLQSLQKMLPLLSTLHVFHWDLGGSRLSPEAFEAAGNPWIRYPLATGIDRWTNYLTAANITKRNHWALLEFSLNDSLDQLIQDAQTLRQLIATQK